MKSRMLLLIRVVVVAGSTKHSLNASKLLRGQIWRGLHNWQKRACWSSSYSVCGLIWKVGGKVGVFRRSEQYRKT